MKIELTDRQKEIVRSLHAKSSSVDQILLERLLSEGPSLTEIELLCTIINNEFMMKGILPSYEPNAYGLELENLLDLVNKSRTSRQSS